MVEMLPRVLLRWMYIVSGVLVLDTLGLAAGCQDATAY